MQQPQFNAMVPRRVLRSQRSASHPGVVIVQLCETTMQTIRPTATTSSYGCLLRPLRCAVVVCYDHYVVLRMPVTAITLCCGCLLRPLRRATDACYGHYAVLWLPATAITSCYGCLLRPLRCAVVACYGHYVVLRLPATTATLLLYAGHNAMLRLF